MQFQHRADCDFSHVPGIPFDREEVILDGSARPYQAVGGEFLEWANAGQFSLKQSIVYKTL